MIEQKKGTQIAQAGSEFSTWLAGPREGKCFMFSDLDGTITEIQTRDSDSFESGRINLLKISHFLQNPNLALGVHSARSFGEIYVVMNDFVKNGARGLPAFSSAEHGAVVFCPRLSAEQESKLEAANLPIFRTPEYSDQTIFNCAKCDARFISEKIIEPIMDGYKGKWASSYTHSSGDDLVILNELAKHDTVEETARSCVRFGSCYLKLQGGDEALKRAHDMVDLAKSYGLYALYTCPSGDDNIHGVDISPGTDKKSALSLINQATKILMGDTLPTVYFGDSENDLVAFETVLAEREKGNKAFLVVSDKAADAAGKLPDGVVFLKDKRNIDGVYAGLEEFFSSMGLNN